MNFYNDIDGYCCQWMRNLIDAGELPQGHVEERSVLDVQAKDIEGFEQCHFFAGIGGWPLALRLAGWRPDVAVWTASLPCQPLSCAGKQLGDADERHLWPVFYRLVRECSPPIIFGEQVASKDGLEWLDGVFADMEREGYACGAANLCSPCVGAPHIRSRLYWVAIANGRGSQVGRTAHDGTLRGVDCDWYAAANVGAAVTESGIGVDGVADSKGAEREPVGAVESRLQSRLADAGRTDRLANSTNTRHARTGEESGSDEHGADSVPQRRNALSESSDGSQLGDTEGGRQRINGSTPGKRGHSAQPSDAGGLDDTELRRHDNVAGQTKPSGNGTDNGVSQSAGAGTGGMGEPNCAGSQPWRESTTGNGHRDSSITDGGWSDFQLVHCRDGKSRRISAQPGDEPLVARLPRKLVPGGTREQRMELVAAKANRVGRLRGYGNAIVPQVAAEFVRSVMETFCN